jgi:hypothetical protein
MCHPGSYYVSGEKDILESDWQALLDFPFELISYNDL